MIEAYLTGLMVFGYFGFNLMVVSAINIGVEDLFDRKTSARIVILTPLAVFLWPLIFPFAVGIAIVYAIKGIVWVFKEAFIND